MTSVRLSSFFKALLPLLLIEAVLFLAVWMVPITNDYLLSFLLAVSVVALPLVAGYRVSRLGEGRLLACIGGTTISGVNLSCAGVAQLVTSTDWMPFFGYVLVTVTFVLPLQVLSGFAGHWAYILKVR